MIYCTSCGTQIQEGQNFCAGCGAPVTGGSLGPRTSMGPTSSTAAQQRSEAVLQKLATLKAQVPPPATGSGAKILIAVLVVFIVGAIAAVAGAVYVGYRVKQKATAALSKLESGDSANRKVNSDDVKANDTDDKNSSDNNSPKNSDQQNPRDRKQDDSDDAKVANGLDAIGGLMDKMGFGDPPPNPYQELPVVQPDDIHKNFCDPNHEATDLPNSATPLVGSSGIPMEKGLLVVHAWGRKSGDSESINTVSRITNKYVEIGDSGTYF